MVARKVPAVLGWNVALFRRVGELNSAQGVLADHHGVLQRLIGIAEDAVKDDVVDGVITAHECLERRSGLESHSI
jgi:hypothetical protein